MNETELIALLRENRLLRSEEEIALFDEALYSMPAPEELDLRYLPELYSLLDDECVEFGVLWGLVHYIGHCHEQVMTDVLIDMTPRMLAHARDWFETMHCRVHNSEIHRIYYKQKIKSLAPEERRALKEFLQGLLDSRTNLLGYDITDIKAKIDDTIGYIDMLGTD